MERGFFLITGTSKGIGVALAKNILERGHLVLGLSRGLANALKSPNYYHLAFDLNDTSRMGEIIEKVDEIVNGENLDFVCLVNNASATGPFGTIENCSVDEIDTHVRIGLVAPMILTSLFVRKFSGGKMRKKIAFISSGAAFRPLLDTSIYCSSKAGLHMFAQCVGLEQESKEAGFEVISIGPGMVDTPMQLANRSQRNEDYAMVDFFKQAHEEGRLQNPDKVAEKIFTILDNKYDQGKYVSVSDV